MTYEEIEEVFTYHRPDTEQVIDIEQIREKARALAHTINTICPQSREQSLALTKLREATMWANASIVLVK